jgi:type VI secretion system protein ImpF
MPCTILDRLLDIGTDTREESVRSRGVSFGQLRGSIERDLENLMNTRCFPDDISPTFSEVRKSLLVYGLSDFSSRIFSTMSARSELKQEIERTIAFFEPRLRNVSVRIETPATGERRLKFKIAAMLQIDDDLPEPVSFDTYFDSNRGEYSISGQ